MRIELNKRITKNFSELAPGDVFLYPENDSLLMKIHELRLATKVVNAVSLVNGYSYGIADNTECLIIDCCLTGGGSR